MPCRREKAHTARIPFQRSRVSVPIRSPFFILFFAFSVVHDLNHDPCAEAEALGKGILFTHALEFAQTRIELFKRLSAVRVERFSQRFHVPGDVPLQLFARRVSVGVPLKRADVSVVQFVVLLVAGLGSIASLIAPYSAYGKIATNLFSPVYGTVNNILAYFAQRMDSYAFYRTDVYIKSLPTFIVAVVTFVLIVILAWRGGRTWCNNVCPVGTVLGFFSRFSLFRPVINTDKCVNCGQCGKKCKASCIDTAAHAIDYSRCVVCMDCLENCKVGAIKYSLRKKGSCKPSDSGKDENFDKSRRNALTIIGMVAGAATVDAAKLKVDGGLAEIMDKQAPVREINPTPAGSRGVKHFQNHCISCQACVSNCPNKVLRPSTKIGNFMQPEMSYELGYCRPECTVCSEVCPAGAILKITPEEKSSIQIGHAVTITQNCVVVRDGVDCGNCARHCPVGAISMVPLQEGGKLVPSVDTERCIGCGACENLCPARPLSAIYVEGHLLHKEI